MENIIDKKTLFHTFDENTKRVKLSSRQQIYYGAPGTGKSYKVKEIVENGDNNFVRTTFHPDSDYSTFVGCYKPCTIDVPRRDVTNKITFENGKEVTEKCIVYDFVPQAFMQAYVDAWRLYAEAEEGKEPKEEYLVIEEINRGNCAQIFGDLFQLLDRNEYGFSDYFINADKDMSKYLFNEFSTLKEKFDDAKKERVNMGRKRDVVDKVLKGEIMLLPSNLYILATMNTSDQSLFPIDSAFKRRWDWVYVPISKGVDRDTKKDLEWKIVIRNMECGWWNFLEKINERIGATTNSEDKKLGFFFCQAKNNVIDAETFVSKVLFYLWNDVFKDYGFEDDLFKIGDKDFLTFDLFYKTNVGETQVNADNVEIFLKNLGVEYKAVEASSRTKEEGDDTNQDNLDAAGGQGVDTGGGHDRSTYSINGDGNYKKRAAAKEVVERYVLLHNDLTCEEVLTNWLSLEIKDPTPFMLSEAEYLEKRDKTQDRRFDSRFDKVAVGDKFIYVSNQWKIKSITNFVRKVNQQDWGIQIKKVK